MVGLGTKKQTGLTQQSFCLTVICGALLTALVVVSFTSGGCGSKRTSSIGSKLETFAFEGRERTYLLHLPPSYKGSSPVPLVLVLHGGGSNAPGTESTTGMSAKADKEGFVAVYPNGTGILKDRLLAWNVRFGFDYALENNVNDVGFIRALIKHLQETYEIEAKRIYVTGISNGGMLSYLLGSELSDVIAAIAPVAGTIGASIDDGAPLIKTPAPKHPVSIIAFHGKKDEHVPYDGGHGGKSLVTAIYLSVSDSISFWVKQDGCSTTPEKEVSANGNIIKDTYAGGKDGPEVVLYTIVDGGHSWPGGKHTLPLRDQPTQDISANDLMWEFFKSHPKVSPSS